MTPIISNIVFSLVRETPLRHLTIFGCRPSSSGFNLYRRLPSTYQRSVGDADVAASSFDCEGYCVVNGVADQGRSTSMRLPLTVLMRAAVRIYQPVLELVRTLSMPRREQPNS
jgi:hypothetical protein